MFWFITPWSFQCPQLYFSPFLYFNLRRPVVQSTLTLPLQGPMKLTSDKIKIGYQGCLTPKPGFLTLHYSIGQTCTYVCSQKYAVAYLCIKSVLLVKFWSPETSFTWTLWSRSSSLKNWELLVWHFTFLVDSLSRPSKPWWVSHKTPSFY